MLNTCQKIEGKCALVMGPYMGAVKNEVEVTDLFYFEILFYFNENINNIKIPSTFT